MFSIALVDMMKITTLAAKTLILLTLSCQKEKKIEQVELSIFHGVGMSTIIFISNKAKMYQMLFGLNVFSLSLLEILQNFYKCMFSIAHEESQVVMAKYRLYFLEKYRDFLTKTVDQTLLDKEHQEVRRILDANQHLTFIHDQGQLMKTWKSWTEEKISHVTELILLSF